MPNFIVSSLCRWPFDCKTPLGYLVAWLSEFAGIWAIGGTVGTFFNLILGSCWVFIVMAEDIRKDLTTFNTDVEANSKRAHQLTCFCHLIQLYSDAKQLVCNMLPISGKTDGLICCDFTRRRCVNEFNALLKYSLFAFMFLLMLSVSSTLVTLQFQLVEYNFISLNSVLA